MTNPHSCGNPATRVVEAYSPAEGRAHGSLDQAHYVCGAHLAAVEDAIRAAGMTAYRPGGQVPAAERRCGDVYDYRAGELRRTEGGEAAPTPDSGATRLGREIAAHVLDAINVAGFGDALAEKVADLVVDRVMLGPESPQGWAREYVTPPWSGYCIVGEHDDCDGTCPPNERGCQCPHHRGEPIPQYGYRLRLVERTAEDYRAEGGRRS